MRITLNIEMELLSDTIFGSGFSIPGGEDIAVCSDDEGYPYLKGSTFKGLLRESAENLAAWMEMDSDYISLLFGESDWNGESDEKRLRTTDLKLINPPSNPESCFDTRSFTKITDGVNVHGSLRFASCIRKGFKFAGELVCDDSDIDFIDSALLGIQHVGTLRNRGFGNVAVRWTKQQTESVSRSFPGCTCLRYRIYLDAPVQITDNENSKDNSFETKHYISGSAIRGMVMSRLAKQDWFNANKTELLSDSVRFYDAYPTSGNSTVIPTPLGFYENPDETDLENVLTTGAFTPSKKRAKAGPFCTINDSVLTHTDARTDSAMRIQRAANTDNTKVFQTGYLCHGQTFEGYICIDNPDLSQKIQEVLGGTVWLGADRYEGFGKCTLEYEKTDVPMYISKYGLNDCEIPRCVYMLLMSPTAVVDKTGTVCTITDEILTDLLGVRTKITGCATSVGEYKSYNRTWQCFSPTVRMLERGSLFKLEFEQPPTAQTLATLQHEGIGIRRSEGFGQILFIPLSMIDSVSTKEGFKDISSPNRITREVEVRRQAIKWLIKKSAQLGDVARNKTGVVQTMCEKALSSGCDLSEITLFIQSINDRNANVKKQYRSVIDILNEVLYSDAVLPISDSESVVQKLELLCTLFNYHRKKEAR